MSERMPYSEMDNITLTKLALLSQRARKEPKCRFTSLAHLLDERFLKECYYQLGRIEQGMDLSHKVIQLDPDHLATLHNLAFANFQLRRLPQALQFANRAGD